METSTVPEHSSQHPSSPLLQPPSHHVHELPLRLVTDEHELGEVGSNDARNCQRSCAPPNHDPKGL
ncbi:hypothetical protein [Oryza sativa Japonica Group]|uniref:Uncharacterized protein B1146F03.15 n=1 Tax=Oryza sativa subsp. japonica TaxID=39947 RepID=Q657I9_ORYSJ|nr:hypothetical protein [Oryza sativa Japonica Group]